MKVTVNDIINIKPGRTRTFVLDKPSDCHTVASLVSYVKKIRKPADVSDYKTTTDWQSNCVTITAIK